MDVHTNGNNYKYWSEKLDGIRVHICTNSKNETVFLSRGGNLLDLNFLELPRILPEDELYGELYYEGKTSSYISTALKHKDKKLKLKIWWCKHLSDWASLNECRLECKTIGYEFVEYGRYEQFDWMQTFPPHIDGAVFRDANYINVCKWKPIRTIDLICTGVTAGNGKYKGKIGALICCTTEGVEVAKCSGMTDEMRDEFTTNPPIGKVLEIAYDKVEAKGKLRWPRFKRIRDDKKTSECLLSQDAMLVEKWSK